MPHPEDQHPGCPPASSYIPRQPAWHHLVLPELGFSNNRRHFVLNRWGFMLLMGACDVACAAGLF